MVSGLILVSGPFSVELRGQSEVAFAGSSPSEMKYIWPFCGFPINGIDASQREFLY